MRDIPPDLAPYSSDRPRQARHLLFIHHSCGGQLLANRGEDLEKHPGTCIYITHPNGGSLRSALERNNYIVHEASYRSSLGEETDIRSWRQKFTDRMDDLLACDEQDRLHTGGARNSIVVFKSCFPNNWIESRGNGPGDPDSGERTLENCRAAYLSLLPLFERRADVLFVACTSPPMARPVNGALARARDMARMLAGLPHRVEAVGRRAREFNTWLKDMDHGWLRGYRPVNAVVFDYYDILTGYGASNWSIYPTRGGRDSHPSSQGNTRAATAFVPFLNKAVSRAGI